MKNPGTSIVSDESNGNVIVGLANADNISLHRVDIVVSAASGAADDMEGMLTKRLDRSADTSVSRKTYSVQVDRMLTGMKKRRQNWLIYKYRGRYLQDYQSNLQALTIQ